MTESNDSLGLTAADHIRVLNSHAGTHIFNYALVNETPVAPELRVKYAEEGVDRSRPTLMRYKRWE